MVRILLLHSVNHSLLQRDDIVWCGKIPRMKYLSKAGVDKLNFLTEKVFSWEITRSKNKF